MPTAYTPGLRVTEHTVIRKVRRLPLKGEVLVKKGQAVASDEIVARALLPGNIQALRAAYLIGVRRQLIKMIVLLNWGQTPIICS